MQIIWGGPLETVYSFVAYYDSILYVNIFPHVVDAHSLMFLDLKLAWVMDNRIVSKTHLKETAGNSYLHRNSCHHPRCKDTIPYSQFCRLRRNCSTTLDYLSQAEILTRKHIEKGYTIDQIQRAADHYLDGLGGSN